MADGPAGRAARRMRQRYLVGTKLLETLSRALFVLFCIYRLPLEEAGRFGLLATVVGLISFFLGYERQIDIQRQVAGRSSFAIRRRMGDTFKFFGAHYLLFLPLLVLGGVLWSASPALIGLIALVVVGEHFLNESYKAVLLDRRTYPLLVMAAAKNALQLIAVLMQFLQSGRELTVVSVLEIWAVASGIYILIASSWWLRWACKRLTVDGDELPQQTILQQYRASAIHFLVGLVAVAALQMDRLVVGGILTAFDLGIYFRHVAVASLALQFFNIVSFNRVAPRIYQLTRENAWRRGFEIVKAENIRFSICCVGIVVLALSIGYFLNYPPSRLGLQPLFIAIVLLGVLLRTSADYKGLLLLSLGGDKALFRNQAMAVLWGAMGLLSLSWAFQLLGAFLGALLTPLFYFLLNRLSVQKRYGQPEVHAS